MDNFAPNDNDNKAFSLFDTLQAAVDIAEEHLTEVTDCYYDFSIDMEYEDMVVDQPDHARSRYPRRNGFVHQDLLQSAVVTTINSQQAPAVPQMNFSMPSQPMNFSMPSQPMNFSMPSQPMNFAVVQRQGSKRSRSDSEDQDCVMVQKKATPFDHFSTTSSNQTSLFSLLMPAVQAKRTFGC